jgi:hypothetical protein
MAFKILFQRTGVRDFLIEMLDSAGVLSFFGTLDLDGKVELIADVSESVLKYFVEQIGVVNGRGYPC